MIDLTSTNPGQIITSMTKRVFVELWDAIQSEKGLKHWTKDKVSETRKERTEELRIRTICLLYMDHRDTFQWLLNEDWGQMEVCMDKNNSVAFRVFESSSQKLARAKASHRQYYGR